MSKILSPGDRPDFVESFHNLAGPLANIDKRFYTVQRLVQLVDLAAQARDKLGLSYRGFTVGCSMLAHNSKLNQVGIYFGGNFTPQKGAEWNCAEKRALKSIKTKGFDRVLALAVVGVPQADRSGVVAETLHPCDKCRNMLDSDTSVTNETLVLTATPELNVFELHTVGSLLVRHMTGQTQPFPDFYDSLPGYWMQILAMNANALVDKQESEILDRIAAY